MKIQRTLTSLILALTAASANAAEPDITVTFAPEPGAWEREFRMIATVNISGQSGPTTSVRTVRTHTISREGDGWSIESVPSKVEIDGVESPLDRTIQEILLGQTFTYHLDAQGQLQSVDGFTDLTAQVTKKIPADSRDAVLQVVNGETQRWRLGNQWETEYAWLYGKALTPGDSYPLTKTLTPPDGPALQFSQSSTPLAADGGKTLQVTYTNEAQPVEGENLGQLSAMKITEQGERTFGIDTGLPLEETSTRRVSVTIRGPGGPINQVREETRHTVYRPLEE